MEVTDEYSQEESDTSKAKENCQENKDCKKEDTDSKKEDRRSELRCCQCERDGPGIHPSDLDAAVPVVSDTVLSPVMFPCPLVQLDDSVMIDVELTAEIRVEDGSMLSLLSSVSPALRCEKSALQHDQLPYALRHFSSKWNNNQEGLKLSTSWATFNQVKDEVVPLFSYGRSVATVRVIEAAKSPFHSSPSTPSSPSSAPSSPSSSPSSTSSSRGGTGTDYHDNSRTHNDSGSVTATGDSVTSTSVSRQSVLPHLPISALHSSSATPGTAPLEMYDPFNPTEVEAERPGGLAAEEDEEEEVYEEDGDKYDPFDPTGSPASEREGEQGTKSERESSPGSVNSESAGPDLTQNLPQVSRAERNKRGKEKDRTLVQTSDPPMSMHSCSPSLVSQDKKGLGRNSNGKRPKESRRDRSRAKRERKDSENSEIEEGEIVAAGHRDHERECKREALNTPFFPTCSKPERILRVLEGDSFVSVRAEGGWVAGRDREVVDDLRRKLVNRRKKRYHSCPSSSLSPLPPPPIPPSTQLSIPISYEKDKSHKSAKRTKEREKHKRKQERNKGEKEKRRMKDRSHQEHKGRGDERRKWEEKGTGGRGRSSCSDSSKRRKNRSRSKHSSHSHHHQQHSSSPPEDRCWERDREKEKDRRRDEKNQDWNSSTKNKNKRNREKSDRRESSSRERHGSSKKARSSREQRDREKEKERAREREKDRDRDRRKRDGRPVVPPSIQDLNGPDLFAIKRTITVTTTTTTTTVPGSPPAPTTAPDTASQTNKTRRKKRRRRKREDEQEERSCDSSLSPLRYHGLESDQFSDKLGIESLSLDGEALDSDYPSLEDSLPPLPPEPLPSPKPKSKTVRHTKKKSHSGKKESVSDSSLRMKSSKSLSSLSPLVGPDTEHVTALHTPTKQIRKDGKDREKGSKKERSGKSKKLNRVSQKAKLQSKVSVLVRDGVSSTTGGAPKRALVSGGSKELGVPGGSNGGGSIAVVFSRDNESRSPFLKPCSEPLTVTSRNKDFSTKARKAGSLASLPPPSSTTSSHLSLVKSKKVKPSSTTSASSSSASSPSSSTAKRKRKQGKKEVEYRELGTMVLEEDSRDKDRGTEVVSWGMDGQSTITAIKPLSPASRVTAPPPCSSSIAHLPPSSSPPCTPPLSLPPSRDTRDSSPDSQTVDSSCKTPEPLFISEDCVPVQTPSPTSPQGPLSPLPIQTPLSAATVVSQSNVVDVKHNVEESKVPASPPCSSSASSANSATPSLSLPPLSMDYSSSSLSVSSSSAKPPPPLPVAPPLPWSLQTGVDCTAGGVLALTALLFKMEEANLASRAKAQEFIQATSQILTQANQSQGQHLPPPSTTSSSSTSQVPPAPAQTSAPASTQFILHSSLPLVSSTKTPPPHLHPSLSLSGGCAQTPPPPIHGSSSGTTGSDTAWDNDSKDPDKYLKKLHTQERAVEEVKLAIKPYYQRKDINKEEYKDILRKAVHKICHSRTGEINPVKVSNLVKLYVQRYKYFRKHGRKMDEEDRQGDRETGNLHSSS